MIRLVLGGARSGKSVWAENCAASTALEVVYIASAEIRDEEMSARIARHRQQRPVHWRTVEEPVELAAVIRQEALSGRCLLIDCLTLWVTNLLLNDSNMAEARADLIDALTASEGEVILVSNETGCGVVPMGELSRRFVDEAGWLNQQVAAVADEVVYMVAGLPMYLKGEKAGV